MIKSKKVMSAIVATSLSLGTAAQAFPNNYKLAKTEDTKIEWKLPNDPLIKRLELEKQKQELENYRAYIKSQIEIAEYYHKLENPEFPKYDLSETELIEITRLCQQEQCSLEGTAAEASLMANRYELCNSGYSTLYSYIKNSGWFANYRNRHADFLDLFGKNKRISRSKKENT